MRRLLIHVMCVLGTLELAAQANPRAMDHFEQGVKKLESLSLVSREDLGKDFLYSNRLIDSAVTCFTSAISIDPNLIEARLRRGECFLQLSQSEKALADFEEVVRREPKNNRALRFLAICKIKVSYGYFDPQFTMVLTDAIEYLSKLIKFESADHDLYFWRSQAKHLLEDYRGAVSDITTSIGLLPESSFYHSTRGLYRSRMKDFSNAIMDYTTAISLAEENAPELGNLYDSRAYSKLSVGDVEGACIDWSRAGELGLRAAYEAIRTNCNR